MRMIACAVMGGGVILGVISCGAREPAETMPAEGNPGKGGAVDPMIAEPLATDRNLEILDMGQGERRKIELRYVVGCQKTVLEKKKSTEQTTVNGVAKESKIKTEQMTAHTQVLRVTPEGDYVVETRIDKEIPLPGAEVVQLSSDSEDYLSPHEQSRLEETGDGKPWKPVVTMTTAPNGTIKDFGMNVPDEYPPAAKEMLTKMMSGIVGAKVEGFPSMPVGIGAKWRNDMTIDYHVFHVEGKNVCELIAHTDEYIHLKCASRMTIPKQRMNLPGALSESSPLATGWIEVTSDQRSWLRCPGNSGTSTTRTRLDMEVTVPGGEIVNVTVNSTEHDTSEIQ